LKHCALSFYEKSDRIFQIHIFQIPNSRIAFSSERTIEQVLLSLQDNLAMRAFIFRAYDESAGRRALSVVQMNEVGSAAPVNRCVPEGVYVGRSPHPVNKVNRACGLRQRLPVKVTIARVEGCAALWAVPVKLVLKVESLRESKSKDGD
jgi:hypothetical protein